MNCPLVSNLPYSPNYTTHPYFTRLSAKRAQLHSQSVLSSPCSSSNSTPSTCTSSQIQKVKNWIVDCANRKHLRTPRLLPDNPCNPVEHGRRSRRSARGNGGRSRGSGRSCLLVDGSDGSDPTENQDPCDPCEPCPCEPCPPPPCCRSGKGSFLYRMLLCALLFFFLFVGMQYYMENYNVDSGHEAGVKSSMKYLRKQISNVKNELQSIIQHKQKVEDKLSHMHNYVKSVSTAGPSNCPASEPPPVLCPPGDQACQKDTGALVRHLVEEAINEYHADRTGRVDFALQSSGAKIIDTPGTETYAEATETASVLGFTVCERKKSPEAILQPNMMPGDCWAFTGSKGAAIIQLVDNVVVNGVTLQHISKKNSPAGHIKSAPRDFCIFGMTKASQSKPNFLGRFSYLYKGPTIQYFPVQNSKPYKFIKFEITSNHGESNYTCVYRLRVHGELHDGK